MITAILRDLVEKLDQLGLDETDIGVVTPFRAQADQVRRSVTALHLPDGRVLVGTVHTYQGDERDLMILSTVATKELPENSFRFMADNPNLLNVAVTRARLSLIVIGDHGFFKGLPGQSYYRKLADYAEELGKVYPSPEELLLLQPLTEEEKPFELGGGIALHKDAPHSNRMTLRRLLASCQGFLWWYDPYMTINALDALALALRGTKGRIRQVRLMTRPDFWENQHGEPACITEEQVTPLKRELEAQGISTQVAVTRYDKENPPPHDRYLFASNLAVNMPPIRNIYQDTAKLAEFLPSSVGAEEFEAWWKQAKVVVE
jgi:hypothetical protein